MARHVFRLGMFRQHLDWEGELVRETERKLFFQRGTHKGSGLKAQHVVIETANPEAVSIAYRNAFRAHDGFVSDARAALVNVEKEQRSVAWDAAMEVAKEHRNA